MDWSNERYVRLYTRDTAEWLYLPWQARATWPLLIRRVDRSGVIATKLGERGVAILIGLPLEVVLVAIPALLEDGCLEHHELGYVIPNFLDAQEASRSDAERQRESRERRRGVTKRDSASPNVTYGHESGRDVTSGHERSQPVTPSLPIRSDPGLPVLAEPTQKREECAAAAAPASRPKLKSVPKYTDAELESAKRVLERLSARTGRKYSIRSMSHTTLIVARLRSGYSEDDLRRIVAFCAESKGWQSPEHDLHSYLRPETLFGPKTIEKYVYDAREYRKNETATPEQEKPPPEDKAFDGDAWKEPSWMTS